MKIIESYFHILNQIKLITNDRIESEAETALIFSSRLFQEYFGQMLQPVKRKTKVILKVFSFVT